MTEQLKLVMDGVEVEQGYDEMRGPVFSPGGQRLAYAARVDGSWRMMVDGVEGAPYGDDIHDPVFSADGKRVAYAGKRSKRGNHETQGTRSKA